MPLLLTPTTLQISISMKSHMWWQNWCWKSKTFRFAHRQIILMTYNTSYDAIQAKYRPLTPSRNETIPFFSHPYPFIPHTHNPTDLYQWNHMWWQDWCWKSKTFRFAHRQIISMTYNTSYDAIQAKHRTQTPNTNQTIAFFSYGYLFTPHTQYPIDLNWWKVAYDDKINDENQILFVSFIDKWYIWLIVYLEIQCKPNIEL
jgi:hypothetical protein